MQPIPLLDSAKPSVPGIIRVLLVDDHTIMRDGLRLMLGLQPDLLVVGAVGDRQSALASVEDLQPDVIIMDVGLPDADGIELAAEILARWHDLRVIILSAIADQEHLDRAMEAGVAGYLLKVNASEDLVRAIRTVHVNEPYLSPEVSAVLLNGYKRLRDVRQVQAGTELSERERQVLILIASGHNTKTIAAEIGVSTKTVDTHRVRVMSKLGLQSVAELTKYAIRMGYTTV
jgi:DNA-binding NarL/FixJ family response regulator